MSSVERRENKPVGGPLITVPSCQLVAAARTPCGFDNVIARSVRTRRQGSRQTSAKHFQQCAELPPLRNRALGPLAVTVLPIPLARRAAATACAAVQSTAPLFRRWRAAGLAAPGSRSALTGCLKLQGLLVFLAQVHSLAAQFFGTPSLLDG